MVAIVTAGRVEYRKEEADSELIGTANAAQPLVASDRYTPLGNSGRFNRNCSFSKIFDFYEFSSF
jgi:hypothetical protein